MNTLSDRLKELRVELGISRSELGRKIGLSRSYMSRLESNQRSRIDSRCLDELRRQLRVNPEWLLTGNGNKYVANMEDAEEPLVQSGNQEPLNFIIAKYAETEMLEKMHAACVAAKDWQAASVLAAELSKRAKGIPP